MFHGAPCKVESLEEAEFTQKEFQQYRPVMERTGNDINAVLLNMQNATTLRSNVQDLGI